MSNPMLIGLTGKKRVGKSSVAAILCGWGAFHEESFAGPIRAAVAAILGVSEHELEAVKESPQPDFGGCTPRRMLQTLGTEWGRQMIAPDLWLASMARRLRGQHVVISDVRFDNEARFIRERGGVVVEVVRPGLASTDGHLSEAGISPDLIDATLVNDGSMTELAGRVRELMVSLVAPPQDEDGPMPKTLAEVA